MIIISMHLVRSCGCLCVFSKFVYFLFQSMKLLSTSRRSKRSFDAIHSLLCDAEFQVCAQPNGVVAFLLLPLPATFAYVTSVPVRPGSSRRARRDGRRASFPTAAPPSRKSSAFELLSLHLHLLLRCSYSQQQRSDRG